MKRIAFLTDLHLDEQFPIDNNVSVKFNFERVLASITKLGIKNVVFGGDIGSETAHKYFFETLKPFSFQLILGNHDKYKDVKTYFNVEENKKELYYKMEVENYLWIFLDTSSDEISKAQLEWLQAELNGSEKIVLFIHYPVLAINTPVDKMYPLKNREELKTILLNYKKSVTIFCGHYHMNDEQEVENIMQYTTQAVSFQLEKNATEIKINNTNLGYRIINVNEDKIETQLVNFKS